jgi:hypothetical protein
LQSSFVVQVFTHMSAPPTGKHSQPGNGQSLEEAHSFTHAPLVQTQLFGYGPGQAKAGGCSDPTQQSAA